MRARPNAATVTSGVSKHANAAMDKRLKSLLQSMGDLIEAGDLAGIDNSTVAAFESEVARLGECDHAITTASGTLGLTLCLEAARVGPGHEVIVPALASFGTLAAVIRRGATAVIVDVDPRRLTICVAAAKAAVTPRTRAVLAVHALGISPDVAGLREVVDGAFILEDATQGFPGPLLGDASSVSFSSGRRAVVLGEGAAVLTRDSFLGERIRRAACLGHVGVRLDGRAVQLSGGHGTFGTSARMPALQAALGLYRLAGLEARLTELREGLSRALDVAAELGLDLLGPPRLPLGACFRGPAAKRELLVERGFRVGPAGVYPAHLEPAALRHKQIRVCPTPRADALAVDLVTVDVVGSGG